MSNEVIHEIRVTETEDGYTIEMKGDKEALREMIFSPRGLNLYGKSARRGRRGRPSRHGGEHRGRHGGDERKAKHQRGRWGGKRWRQHIHDQAEAPQAKSEYDLGPWLATDSANEPTSL